jgi:hypothetical protein
MTEEQLMTNLNNNFKLKLDSTEANKFCRWDGESDKYLAELKCRNAHYDTLMIEYDKLDCVKEEADKTGREFLYCVSTPKGVYVFNVSDLCRKQYDFKWENKYLPSKTDFGGSMHKTKKVGYMSINDCTFSGISD